MGYSSWKPAFRQGIIDRMLEGDSARQIANELELKRTDVQNLFDDYKKKHKDLEIEQKQVETAPALKIYEYPDEWVQPLWEGFLKQRCICTIKHSYCFPDHRYFVDTGAPIAQKQIVKTHYDKNTPFADLTYDDRQAIGAVVKDIKKYGTKGGRSK